MVSIFQYFNFSIFQYFNIFNGETKRFSKAVFPWDERRRSSPLIAQMDRRLSQTYVSPWRAFNALQEEPQPKCEASKNHHGVSRWSIKPYPSAIRIPCSSTIRIPYSYDIRTGCSYDIRILSSYETRTGCSSALRIPVSSIPQSYEPLWAIMSHRYFYLLYLCIVK